MSSHIEVTVRKTPPQELLTEVRFPVRQR